MTVVSDTSPLRYLVALGRIEVLAELFGKVYCPARVIAECQHSRAPHELREWATAPPEWVKVIEPAHASVEGTERLDLGEAEAIRLAIQLQANLILIDERRGQRVAAAAGLNTAGTLTLIAEAATNGLLNFEATVAELRQRTNFRVTDWVVAQILESLEEL